MVNRQCTRQHIRVQDARIHVSSILIRRLLAGMRDVWVNALHHVIQHARILVLVAVWAMMPKKVTITNLEKDKDAHHSVLLTA